MSGATHLRSVEYYRFALQVGDEIVTEDLDDDEIRGHIATAFGFWWGGDQIHWHAENAPPRVTRRCHYCNPCANPRPLPVNGREYHRRHLARRRRRGRR